MGSSNVNNFNSFFLPFYYLISLYCFPYREITGGRFTSVSDQLCESSSSLESLVLSNNRLQTLQHVENCKKLKVLKADKNSLRQLEGWVIGNLSKLDVL